MVKDILKNLFRSATKLVLVLLVMVLVACHIFVVMQNVHDESVINSQLNLFETICVAVVSFYFGKSNLPDTTSKQDNWQPTNAKDRIGE